MALIVKHGKIILLDSELKFIKDNFQTMTNQQIAEALGLKKTFVRMKAYSLGLQRFKLEYWCDDAIAFLKSNYHIIGNLELVRIFKRQFPKQKGWTTSHISKKLKQLGLKRSIVDLFVIKERNRNNGSYGNKNVKNNPKPPCVYFRLNRRTKVLLKPEQSIEDVKRKFQYLLNY